MKESLELKLHNFLKKQGGKHIDYSQIQYLVEKVWLTPKGGHYRMETLTRRWRHDNSKEKDVSNRIGKDFKNGAIVALYYKSDSMMIHPLEKPLYNTFTEATTPKAREFLSQWSKPEPTITYNLKTLF